MINEKKILTRINATNEKSPVGAYAEEIPSNEYVTGNLNSQFKYMQTKEEDNGRGEGMSKSASKILEKIAFIKGLKDFPGRLFSEVRDAPALNQLGLAGGAAFGIGKATSGIDNMRTRKQHTKLEERSLRALGKINSNLNRVVVKS